MRAPTLESHDLFEGVGAHELNSRFDWIPEEHGDDTDATEYDPPSVGLFPDVVSMPAMARAQSLLTTAVDTSPGRLDGADTSHYQFTQGGGKMKIGPGLWWWMHKASQSTSYRDPTLAQAIVEMSSAAVEIPGSYHWGSATTDPQKQAANWLGAVGPTYTQRLVFMGDMEEAGLTVEIVVAIYETIEAVTKRPCSHYTGLYVSGGTMYIDDRIRFSKYGPRPIIVAAYITRVRLNALVATQGKGKPYHAWQFSSDGPVPVVAGRCDMDEVADKQAFQVSLNGAATPTPTPPPQEDDMNDTDFFTHADKHTGDSGEHDAGWYYWCLMADGTRRDVTGLELDKIRQVDRSKCAALTEDEINSIPVYVPPVTSIPPATPGSAFPTSARGRIESIPGDVNLSLS